MNTYTGTKREIEFRYDRWNNTLNSVSKNIKNSRSISPEHAAIYRKDIDTLKKNYKPSWDPKFKKIKNINLLEIMLLQKQISL